MANNKLKITYDQFMKHGTWPWKIYGQHLDDIVCLRNYYVGLMVETSSLDEMKDVTRQFKWLAKDALSVLNRLQPNSHRRIVRMLEKGTITEELSPISVPHVMMWAHIVSDNFGLPEFPAACQYVSTQLLKMMGAFR